MLCIMIDSLSLEPLTILSGVTISTIINVQESFQLILQTGDSASITNCLLSILSTHASVIL